MQQSLAVQLQELTFEFRGAQKSYLNKIQKKKHDTDGFGFVASGGGVSTTDIDVDEEDKGFNDMQIEMLHNIEQDVDMRDQEIIQIAKSIEELATIFKELAVLVIDQGTILDRIDYNMEQVVDRVDQGVEQLEKARKYQKSSRPIRCICFLLIVIVVLTIILANKPWVKNLFGGGASSSSPPPAPATSGGGGGRRLQMSMLRGYN